MAGITIKVDPSGLSGLQKMQAAVAAMSGQLPFATSLALNQTARDVQLALKAQTSTSFVNPVAYTRNAFRYTKSTKADLTATVFPDPSRRYFPTEIFGGTRRVKSYEAYLRGLGNGALPSGKLIPTRHVLNAAGNPKKAIFSLISSKLSTTDQGGFFIGTPKGGNRQPGVYRRSRGQLYAYFVLLESEPRYRPRFPMERIGNETAKRVFPSHLANAIERAIKSAR